MSELPADLPLVPAIWPLGEGVVLTSWAIEPQRGLGLFMLRGVRDVPDGVTTQEEPDGRITNLTISTKNPGYARWAKERASLLHPKEPT